MIQGNQCAAARSLLGWKQKNLSLAILASGGKLSVTAITAFENGGTIRQSNADQIVNALEHAGVIFIEENGDGAGVRLRKI